jgi:hypothetical protein
MTYRRATRRVSDNDDPTCQTAKANDPLFAVVLADVFDFQRDGREDQCSISKIESAICQRLGAFGRIKRYLRPVIVYTETVVCNDEDATLAAEARMERVMGIEPSYEAWEAAVLPLNYTRGSGVIL